MTTEGEPETGPVAALGELGGLTLLQCGRQLRFAEALAVFDSAARSGVPAAAFRRVARQAHGPGSAQVRRLARFVECSTTWWPTYQHRQIAAVAGDVTPEDDLA